MSLEIAQCETGRSGCTAPARGANSWESGTVKIELDQVVGQNAIRSYAPGRVTVNQDIYETSIVVMPDRIIADWRPKLFDELTAADLDPVVAMNPEVVLIGTGHRLRFPAAGLTRSLVTAQIGFEVMDTGAACRTYNVLMAEGRRVAAALLIAGERS